MADIKIKYPSTSSTAVAISLASLADDNTNGVAGRASTAINNTTNLDIDHIVSGVIEAGTSPTVSRTIEIWVYAPRIIVTGTPTYPDGITGTDAAKTFTSRNVLLNSLKLGATLIVDATSDRDYDISPFSVASLYGGQLPPYWGLFVVNRTGVALNATAGNHVIHYSRVQAQSV